MRKTGPSSAAPKKANILGGRKTTKLGAKKVTGADDLDFEAAEKKAKEEAERIAKLGYDPDAEETPIANNASSATSIASPIPVSPSRGPSFGATSKPSATVDSVGAGVQRLGFGMVGASAKPAAAAAPSRPMGFGSVGGSRGSAYDDSEKTARDKFGTQKGISSDEFFGRNQFDPNAQSEAKQRLQGFEGATSISSNAYFGRPEEEEGQDDYGDLETAAKDFVRKFGITAGDDLENVTQLLGEGASRLQGAIRNYLNS